MRRQPPTLVAITIALAALFAGPIAGAQLTHSQAELENARARGEKLGPIAETPIVLDSIGLTIFLPEGASSHTSTVGASVATQIRLADKLGAMTIQRGKSNDTSLSVTAVANDNIRMIMRRTKKAGEAGEISGTDARLLHRNSDLVPRPAGTERFYMQTPGAPGRPDVVHGFTIFSTGPGEFVVFQLVSDEQNFERARRQYEGSIATILLTDAQQLASRRQAALTLGMEVLETLTEDDYRHVFDTQKERWERLYRPAAGGLDADAQELGYRRIRARIGRRGELDARKPRAAWGTSELDEGYLLQIDMLLLDGPLRIDSQASYFLSFDREEETWSVRMAVRGETKTDHWTETGARRGQSMTVTVESEGSAPKTARPSVQPDGYLSIVESFLLGPLLIRANTTGEMAFNSYQSRASDVRLRLDTVENPPDRAGLWRVTTVLGKGDPPQVGTFNERGNLIRMELPDGRIWEPIDFRKLYRLWESKGLPLN